MKRLCKIMAIAVCLAISPCVTQPSAAAEPADSEHTTANRYAGYELDGRTSASVLAAKRSHSVSKSDETVLATFSGSLVIGLIFFLVHILQKPK
jgi:hypothetical protein